jgi:hypothetical protein
MANCNKVVWYFFGTPQQCYFHSLLQKILIPEHISVLHCTNINTCWCCVVSSIKLWCERSASASSLEYLSYDLVGLLELSSDWNIQLQLNTGPNIVKLRTSLRSRASNWLKWILVSISANQILEIWDSGLQFWFIILDPLHLSQSDAWEFRLVSSFSLWSWALSILANEMLGILDWSSVLVYEPDPSPFKPIRCLKF